MVQANKHLPTAPVVSNTTIRSSCSQPTNIFPISIIVKKDMHEGEITLYDPVNNYYKVKFKDGDREEYTYDEILMYRKSKKLYFRKKETKSTTCGSQCHFNNSAMFIPTKANPNPVKKGYMTKLRVFLMQQQHKEYCQLAHSALAGAVWDDKLKKLASYKELVNHCNSIN